MVLENTKNAVIELENNNLVQSYKRPNFVLDHGKGMTLYDTEGNAYQDWVAGIAVNALGYGDAGLTQALQQASAGLFTPATYYTAQQAELAALPSKNFADRVFFSNSGTETNEAIKFARKVAYDSGNRQNRNRPLQSRLSRAMGRWRSRRKKVPETLRLMPGAVLAEFNNIASAEAAIMRTPPPIVQGDHVATPEFLQALRAPVTSSALSLFSTKFSAALGARVPGRTSLGVTRTS